MEQQTGQRNIQPLDDVQEIDLIDLFGYYMSRLWLLIAAVVIGAVIAGAYTHYMIPDRFTAVSRMYMISASSSSVVDLSDLNIGASLSNDYVELMKSRPIIEDVITELGLEYTYEQVLNMIRLDVVTNTQYAVLRFGSAEGYWTTGVLNSAQNGRRRCQETVTITATTPNGLKATCKVNVKHAPESIALDKETLTLNVNSNYTFKKTLSANSASSFKWTSSDPEVVRVYSTGKIVAQKSGTAVITVTTYNGKTASCEVTVA